MTRIFWLLAAVFAVSATLHAQPADSSARSGFAEADDARIYFEARGSGPAVVLVPGLGAATWLWEQQIEALAEYFTVVSVDNRGVGRSDVTPGPYSAALLADDLVPVLDTLGIDRAHVVGASLGGFVAQEFALRHPDRLDRLVLVSTSAGGATHVPMSPETLGRLMAAPEGDDPRAHVRSRLPLAFTDAFMADSAAVEHLVDQRMERPQSPVGYQAQLVAGATFDAADRVQRIDAPTLVAAAADDLLVPVANAHRLVEALPNAELRVYPGLGHQFFVEAPQDFNRDVIDFLLAAEPRR